MLRKMKRLKWQFEMHFRVLIGFTYSAKIFENFFFSVLRTKIKTKFTFDYNSKDHKLEIVFFSKTELYRLRIFKIFEAYVQK